MQVSELTLYEDFRDVEIFLTSQSVKELKQAAEAKYGNMYDLTIAEFHECANGDMSRLGDVAKPTVLQVYWCKRFEEFVREYAETIKRLTVTPTPEEQQASGGMLKTDWAEAMLIFARKFFGLQSFKQAEQITIGEILIAKKAQYNEDVFRRKLAKIQMSKYKRK